MPDLPCLPAPPPPDWPALWSAALDIAARRRAGGPPGPAPALGAVDAHSAELFALYQPLLAREADAPPWVIAQLGQSLDGCIATQGGDSCFVTGAGNLDHLHRLRALCDAVIVGAGTVVADDPRLTTRRVPGPNPVRVLLDPGLRVPPTARLLQDGAAPTLWLFDAASSARADALAVKACLVPIAGLRRDDGTPDTQAVVHALTARGLRLLFVEGGGATVSAFARQGLLDRLHLAVAPVFIGAGRRGLDLPAMARLADCPRPPCRVLRLGDDVLWDLAMKPPAQAVPSTLPDERSTP